MVPAFWEDLFNHAHGAITHFPIALLFVSAGLDFFAAKRPGLRGSAWLLLVLGTAGTLVATVSGLVAHLAYNESPILLPPIQQHQYLAFATTAIFVGLTAWRFLSIRRGKDIGGARPYLAIVAVGLALLGLTGFLGGNLLLEWGIGVNPEAPGN